MSFRFIFSSIFLSFLSLLICNYCLSYLAIFCLSWNLISCSRSDRTFFHSKYRFKIESYGLWLFKDVLTIFHLVPEITANRYQWWHTLLHYVVWIIHAQNEGDLTRNVSGNRQLLFSVSTFSFFNLWRDYQAYWGRGGKPEPVYQSDRWNIRH